MFAIVSAERSYVEQYGNLWDVCPAGTTPCGM
jgi:hypothetical protein